MSYLMVEQMFWLPLFGQLNAFRRDVLDLPAIHLGQGGNLPPSLLNLPFFMLYFSLYVTLFKVQSCCMSEESPSCIVSAKLLDRKSVV